MSLDSRRQLPQIGTTPPASRCGSLDSGRSGSRRGTKAYIDRASLVASLRAAGSTSLSLTGSASLQAGDAVGGGSMQLSQETKVR